MRRGWRRLAGAVLAALAGAAAGQEAPLPRVMVDVGHTLAAPGATSARGRSEFGFNLALARQVVAALRRQGYDAQLINEDGRIASLQARAAAADGADFLLSIHHDSVAESELHPWLWEGRRQGYNDDYAGHSLFVSQDNPELARSTLCARVIGARLQRMGFVPTHKNGQRRAYADYTHAVHYYDALAVLRHAVVPAVLFEAGVIRNRDEELALADPQRQARMADGIATALHACLSAGLPAEAQTGMTPAGDDHPRR